MYTIDRYVVYLTSLLFRIRFIEVDDDSVLVNDRDRRDATLGEHVYYVKHRCGHACRSDGMERISVGTSLRGWWPIRHICTDLEFS